MNDTTEQGMGEEEQQQAASPGGTVAGAEAPLQFDKAEMGDAPAAPSCASCKQPAPTYYQVGAAVVCPSCHALVVQSIERGTGRQRLFRAAQYGIGAAVVGSVVWYGIREAFKVELGLVAIGVGIFVGVAVKRGSGGFGGPRYQALAMVLTYLSITMANVPIVLGVLGKNAAGHATTELSAVPSTPTASPPGPATALPASTAAPADPAAAPASVPAHPREPSLVGLLIAWVFVFGFALIVPFLSGTSGIMGLVIIGIALYEAWKITRSVPPVIRGPFRVGDSG